MPEPLSRLRLIGRTNDVLSAASRRGTIRAFARERESALQAFLVVLFVDGDDGFLLGKLLWRWR